MNALFPRCRLAFTAETVLALLVLLAVMAILVSSGGCCPASGKLDLEERWRPLVRVVTDPSLPEGVSATYGDTMSTHDLCELLAADPVQLEGVYTHERFHACQQLAYPGGPASYMARYRSDDQFKANEEFLATKAQIIYVIQNGGLVDVPFLSKFMSTTYKGQRGEVIIPQDFAAGWINGIVYLAKHPAGG